MSRLLALVLAGGQGTRMRSATPKVLHPLAGRPLLHYPIAAALGAEAARVVVVVSPETRDTVAEYVGRAFPEGALSLAVQSPARGTGDAARVGLESVSGESFDRVLVLCGDTPLVRTEDVTPLLAKLDDAAVSLAVLSCELADARGYGRIIRDARGQATAVVEDRDLAPEDRARLTEVNAGIYAARLDVLKKGIASLTANNAQGEYYLTDVVAFAAKAGGAVAVKGDPSAMVGVNDRAQLASAEETMYRRIADGHRRAGVTVRGDARIDEGVTIGVDAVIEAGVRLRGKTGVGAGAFIDVGCVVTDSEVGPRALLKPYSVMDETVIGSRAEIGPFARLRSGSVIDEEAHVGNFVETKKTRLRKGAKANHLAYLGDGDVGAGANVGAGVIFCNYDGFDKHKTTIGERAFVGSDSQLVAPVTIGNGAYVATGTTVTKDVPDDALAISRTKQDNKEGYASRLRGRLEAMKKRKSAG
jgi:bifunctional UDP-N-acetylglucosamine pyrophosphorylase/glucosamine-1-phosphate N-acetyltransferase